MLRWRLPGGRRLGGGEAGDGLGVLPVGFVTLAGGLGELGDLKRIDHTDRYAMLDPIHRRRFVVDARGLHADMQRDIACQGLYPPQATGKTGRVVIVLARAPLRSHQYGHIEL